MKKSDIRSGKNLLTSKSPSLEEMYEAAVAIKDASETKYLLANKLVPALSPAQIDEVFGDLPEGGLTPVQRSGAYLLPTSANGPTEWQEAYEILEKGFEHVRFSITEFCRHKLLNALKLPPSFYDRIPSDLKFNTLNRLARDQKNYITLNYVSDEDGQNTITGVVTSKSIPLFNTDILAYLADWVKENNFTYKIEHAHMDVNHMSFKIVLLDEEMVLDESDETPDLYSYGIAIQNSSNGYCQTVINPMLFRVVCSNGLIAVKDEKSLIKQQNLALPAEALKVVLADVLDWMQSSESAGILDFLAELSKSKVKWNMKRIKAMLPAVLDKVGADVEKAFKKALFDFWPEGDDTFAIPAYDVINTFTNKAQAYSGQAQSQIEANVMKLLTKAVKDKKEKMPATV